MTTAILVIKHGGKRKSEAFDRQKLLKSIEAAASSVSLTNGVANDIADKATASVETWLADKTEVTSDDIRRIAARIVTKFSAEAGYLYQNQKEVL